MGSGGRLTVLAFVALAGGLALATPASASEKPVVQSVTIAGDPIVGGALRAVAEVTGDPAPVLSWRWERCDPAELTGCEVVAGATSETFVPQAVDVGWTLVARVTATNSDGFDRKKSAPTTPVRVVPAGAPAPVYELPTAPVPRYLRPFPVVRIRGSILARGARITLLRVKAPLRARVTVRCAGDGCPLRFRRRRAGRIHALERFLPAGVRIVIRVHRRGYVGKYVRIRIRGGRAPARRDACVLSGSSPPIACPRT